jgi:hypothetical protein
MKLRVVNQEAVSKVLSYIRESEEYTFEKFLKSKLAWNEAENKRLNEVVIKCPFHADKTPSMGVDELNNRCHCFSCDRGGGLINIMVLYSQVVEKSGLTFYQVLNNLVLADRKMQMLCGVSSIFKTEQISVLDTGFSRRSFKVIKDLQITNFLELASVMKKEQITSVEDIKLSILFMQDGYDPKSVYRMIKGESASNDQIGETFGSMNLSEIMAGVSF